MVMMKELAPAESTIVVTGAGGYVGSWLVMKLLNYGYTVRATLRDSSNGEKTKPLLDLPGAESRLSLWEADLLKDGSFDDVISGSVAVFHVATPMDFDSNDPENEVIKPAVEGMLSIMKSCKKAGTVKRVIYTSSAGTVNVEEHQKPEYDENSWSDIDYCRRVKMTGWMYFVSKSLAEKAAWDFAKANGIDLITIIPTLVIGAFITTAMPPSMITALSLITRNEAHYSIIKQAQLVHLDDLCEAHILLLNHPKAQGRYICSSQDTTIYDIAKMIRQNYPQYYIPHKFEGIDEDVKLVRFSSKRLLDLGFRYKYSMENMYDEAIKVCMEKKLIPLQTVEELKLDPPCELLERRNNVASVVGCTTKATINEHEEDTPIASH